MALRPSFVKVMAPALLVWLGGAGAAVAQVARVSGVVRDLNGQPLRGALVTVDGGAGAVTAATDEEGRFSVVGTRSGVWKFEAQAPGYLTETGEVQVRALGVSNPPLTIALRRSGMYNTGPLAGLPARDLQEQLSAAYALFDQEHWTEAVTAYRALLARAPSLTTINLQIAAAHRHLKDHAAAIEAYRALLVSDPGNEDALTGIAATQLERGDAPSAEQTLREAAANPDAGRLVLFGLAELLASQGRQAEAVEWYEKAATADPSWGRPRYRLGELALAQGNRADAARYLGEVIAVDPASPEATLAATALDQLKQN
jgi:thioredoxin-like negative regulator of GroEL